MIYTLTMNAAIDLNLTCDQVQPRTINHSVEVGCSPNGKAVNVSIVLNHLGVPSVVMGIFGGFTGAYILDSLSALGITTQPFFIEDKTRINVFVNDQTDEYKFVCQGGFVPVSVQQDILDSIRNQLDMTHLVVSGSLPPGVSESFLDQLMETCSQRNIGVILDISHPHLSVLLEHRPLLIKPNDDELFKVFGLATATETDVVDAAKTLHAIGAQNVLLTMGEKGMYFSNGSSIYFCNAPQIELVSSACAGDSALAAFLSIWLVESGDIENAMVLASAIGADVAASAGIGSLNNYSKLIGTIQTRQLV
ncbi:1-phosphofructokinase family hexose kinase [Vibrio mimicus]